MSPKPELSRIRKHSRSIKLLGLGAKSGMKMASVALGVALGRTNKKEAYEQLLSTTMKSFVKEVEQLKGGMMKAGQLLSMYGEYFFPEEVNQVLKTLQDRSVPLSFEVMEKKIQKTYSKEVFARMDICPTPIGAASMGQVYRLTMQPEQAGQAPLDLALKVQYPGVAKAMDSDLATLKRLLALGKWIPDNERFHAVYEEIKDMLKKEADYKKELRCMEKYHALLADDPVLKLPQVYPEYSTKTCLAMEYVQGRPLSDPRVQQISQQRRNRLGLAVIRLLFQEVFAWRMVQTDPHLGNFLVQLQEDGFATDRLVLLDFGAVRTFPKPYMQRFTDFAYAALREDPADIIASGIALEFLKDEDSPEMKNLFVELLLKAGTPFSEKHAGACADDGSFTQKDYDWSREDLVQEISQIAKNAVFSFQLRPPPKETVFLQRKLVGTTVLLKVLGAKIGPRNIALRTLTSSSSS